MEIKNKIKIEELIKATKMLFDDRKVIHRVGRNEDGEFFIIEVEHEFTLTFSRDKEKHGMYECSRMDVE